MATASPNAAIEEFDEIEEFPDAPVIEEFDEPNVAAEAVRNTAGAMQAVDLMTLPGRIMAAQPRELTRDEQLFNEAESVAAQMKQAEDAGQSSSGLADQYFALREQISPGFLQQVGSPEFRPDEVTPQAAPDGYRGANWLGRAASELLQSVGSDTLAARVEELGQSPVGMNFQANIGPAAGGALGAGLMMVPGGQSLGARTILQSAATVVPPILGGATGSMAGGLAQEKIHQATETPEETQARHEALTETRERSPFSSMLGASLANAPFMSPSLSVFRQAMAGNKTAQQALGAAAAIGGGTSAIMSKITGQPVSLAGIAQAAIENMVFNKPTRLGRAFGLPAMETGTVEEKTSFEPITVEPTSTPKPDAVEITSPTPTDGSVRAPEVTTEDVTLPTPEGGEGVPPSGPEGVVETAPVPPRAEVTEPAPEVTLTEETTTTPVEETPTPEPTPEPTSPVVEEAGRAIPPTAPGEEGATGIRNAIVDPARAAAGIPPREIPLARSFPQIHAEAKAVLENDPTAGSRLVDELAKEVRPLTDAEDAVLTFEQNSREQERVAAVDLVNNTPAGEARDAAIARLRAADDALFNVYQVGQAAGTANARGLNARRLMQNKDFTLAKMLNERRAIENNGEPLTQKQTDETTALHKRIQELESKLAGKEASDAKASAQAEFRRTLRETKKAAGEAAKEKKTFTDFMDSAEKAAMDRIIKRRGRLQVTVDPLNIAGLVDEAIVGAAHVARGVRDFDNWSSRMLATFGDRIKPHLQALFAKSSALSEDTSKTFTKNAPKTPAQVMSGIKEGAKLEQRVVYDLARAHVQEGADDFDQVMKQVTKDLQTRFPDVTERQVMDALSGYGKTTTPSKESDLVKMREFKNLARLTSQLQDAQAKIAPLKTGPQRDKATARVRELQAQVNAAIRAAGFKSTSAESQLATAHTARVTRLKNAIEDTQRAIDQGKRPEKAPAVPWTPEEIALRDQLNEVKARLDDVLNEPDNAQLNSLLRRIEDVSERIKSGNIGSKPRTQGADTKEVAQAKSDLAALNQQLAGMRKAARDAESPPRTPDEKRLAALEKRRDELFTKVSKGDTSTKTGKPSVDTAEQAKVRAEIDALNKQLSDMRKAEKSGKAPDEAQFIALHKRLGVARAKLASGNIAPTPRGRATVDTERVATARRELAEVNQQINNLRNNSEEIRLGRDKARIAKQIQEIQGRINRGDYEPRTRREPAMDREKLEAQYELSKIKEKWNEGLIKAKRAARPLREKIWDSVGETINLGRQLVTSADFPPVFRQGLFAIGRPVTAAKAVVDSFKAMVSEKQRFKIQQEIENRPNAPLYNRSKLYLAKDTAQPLTQMEENFMGNWFKQLPRWTVVGPLLRASERSYNTFLNKLRADTFDSAVKLFNISETDTASLNALAANVNTFTGRSTLPVGALERGAPALNTFLFAPRFMMSRFKIATGQPLWGGTAKSRLSALDTYARTLGGVALMYGLAKMAGAEIETDPRSSDFAKIKMGNTRLDPLGGLSQITTFLTRVTTGETKTGSGKLVPLRENLRPLKDTKYGAKGKPNMVVGGTGDVLKNFLRSKLNPAMGSVWNTIEGKDITGKPVTPGSMAVNMTVPISYQDILSTMEDQGIPKGAALFALSLFGMGLNTYENRKK